MLRLAFARPWRQTEGLLRSVTTLLGLSLDVPDHTTLSRRSAALSLVTALAVPAGPVTVVIDSTGLKIFGAGEWQMAKHGGAIGGPGASCTWPSIRTPARFSLRP